MKIKILDKMNELLLKEDSFDLSMFRWFYK